MAQCAAVAGHFGVPPILVTGDEATCREARKFFGGNCVTVAVKQGIAREAAVLYPFAETRKALYEGAKRAVAAIPNCKPYRSGSADPGEKTVPRSRPPIAETEAGDQGRTHRGCPAHP